MEVNITPKQLERLRRASDITEIQMLMAKFVESQGITNYSHFVNEKRRNSFYYFRWSW